MRWCVARRLARIVLLLLQRRRKLALSYHCHMSPRKAETANHCMRVDVHERPCWLHCAMPI